MDFAEFERGAETAGEDRYRDIFESAPVSIWVEDWSAAKRVLDGLRRATCEPTSQTIRTSSETSPA